ncbi:hypothetical protein LZG04_09205 [Saccharothrix sp. S26]|uniref:hypothetical protein n=1 Tax=Saccharothrix sp. S26 TaxID=2907215 RepID=UPI001F2342C0|nr:hypothetical protein [Saccharothrix sp. S26]MCE6994983.1 hypothetical protein [Saccharothrix sp. S26]
MRWATGRYRLVHELGRGGMGAVWLGQDTVLDRDVAVTDHQKEAPYPSAQALAKRATEECTRVFLSDRVIGADKETTLRFWVVIPTAEAWKLRTTNGHRTSDRTSSCYVGRADGAKLTEPVMTED